jgi:hypothetical protein
MTLIGKNEVGFVLQFRRSLAILAVLAIALIHDRRFALPMSRCPDSSVFFQKLLFFLHARFFHLRERYMF